MPCAAVDFSWASWVEPGRATAMVMVSLLVSLIQPQATPPLATATAAALPAVGENDELSEKLGLKLYIVCGEMRVLQPIVTGVAEVGADGAALGADGFGVGLEEEEELGEGELEEVAVGLMAWAAFGVGAHPARPTVATTASTNVALRKSFMNDVPLNVLSPSSPTARVVSYQARRR